MRSSAAAMPPTPAHAWPLLAQRLGAEVVVKHENHTPTGAFKVRGGLVYVDRLKRERPQTRGLDFGDARQSRPEPGVRGGPLRRAGDDLCAARQFGREEPRDAGVRRRPGRAWRGFPGGARGSRAPARRRDGLEIVPSFHPDLVLGRCDLRARTVASRAGSRCALCADRAGLRHLRLHPGARSAGAENRDRRRAIDRSAVLRAVVRGRHGRDAPNSSNTLADGMATRVPDADALAIIRKGASRIVQVTDDEIGAAIRAYWTDTHNLAEGAGAAALAAALQEKTSNRGKRVGLILSGGNIDFDLFQKWIAARSQPSRQPLDRRHAR